MRKNRCRPRRDQPINKVPSSSPITVAKRSDHRRIEPRKTLRWFPFFPTKQSPPQHNGIIRAVGAGLEPCSVVKLQNTQTTVVRGSVTPLPSILTILEKGRSPARNVQLVTKRQGPNRKNLTNNAAPCSVVLLCKRHCRGVTSVGNVAVPPSYARLNLRAAAPKHSIPPDSDRQQGTNKKTIQGFLKSPRPESSVSCHTN